MKESLINLFPSLKGIDLNSYLHGFRFLDNERSRSEAEQNKLDEIGLLSMMISAHRLSHSISVASLCARIGALHGLDPRKAYIIGLLHDCAKGRSDEALSIPMKDFYPEYLDYPAWMYHQFIGKEVAREYFGIKDEEALDAISFHASGKKMMNSYGKLVYACDKIDPLRGYDSSYMIVAMEKDLDEGFAFVLSENRIYITQIGFSIDNQFSKECFDYYLKKD